ncbi:hypothetical protein Tco_1160195, partial [Tanacetum coccineum]
MNMRKGRTQPYEANVMLLIEIVFPVMLNASSNCCFDPLQRLPVVVHLVQVLEVQSPDSIDLILQNDIPETCVHSGKGYCRVALKI